MLTFSEQNLVYLDEFSERRVVERLKQEHARAYPALLPRFPDKQKTLIAENLIAWGRSLGATWQSSLTFLAALAETFGGGVFTSPLIKDRIEAGDRNRDQAILDLQETASAEDWSAIAADRFDLPFFAPPKVFEQRHDMRSAFASQLVAWEFAEDTSVNKAVDAAMSEAETLGWSDLIDAGFVLSAGARIYGAPLTHIDKSWRTDIVDSGVTPLEGLAMYRARIMLDHGRRV